MKRKFFSCLMFAALMGAGMISVTSCADYDEDIHSLQQQVTDNEKIQDAIQKQMDGMQSQIDALKASLNAMKSCQCGDVDARIAEKIAEALKGLNYASPADVALAIEKALASLEVGLTADEVQALIDAYHAAHPGVSTADVQTLIEQYLKNNPGLTEADIEAIVKAYHDAHPSASLTDADVKAIVETYINQLQHFTQDQIEAMIQTAITQALANFASCNCDSYTKSQIEALIAAAINDYAATDGHGLTQAEVQTLIDAAIAEALKGITHPESGLSEAEVNTLIANAIANALQTVDGKIAAATAGLASITYVQQLIEQAKCECPALTAEDVSSIASTVIEQYMKDHPYTLDTDAVKDIVNSVIDNSSVINNIQTSITTLSSKYDELKSEIDFLKNNVYTKGEVFTKTEVTNLINTLIQQAVAGLTPGDVLSPEQQAIVNQLIAAAIDAYNTAHPDCNCQYDAAAFNELVQKVANNTNAINGIVIPDVSNFVTNQELETAIQGVKDLIPAAADLSNYVTIATLNNIVVDLNTTIGTVQSTANEALEKAKDALQKAGENTALINGLTTTVSSLNTLYQTLSPKVDKAVTDAADALAKATTNANEIATLKQTYESIISRLEALEANQHAPYDDTELRNRIQTLEGDLAAVKSQIENLATKEELNNQVNSLKGLINDARSYAEQVAAAAAQEAYKEALKDSKDYTDTEIGKLKKKLQKTDELLQAQIDALTDDLTDISNRITNVENALNDIKVVANYVTKLITNIELQGTKNPAFGYYSLPLGVTSNVLIAYYGQVDVETYFPAIEDRHLIYKDEENWITEEDAARIGYHEASYEGEKGGFWSWNGGTTLLQDGASAGKLYLTINPSSVDFTGTEFDLVNSLGEKSPITLGKLKKSTDKLTFGQTRAQVEQNSANGFYEADATVDEENLNKIKFPLRKQTTDALEDIAKNKLEANISNISQAIYNQFNGILDAYAVQATWHDELGDHTVTSKYGIAATAISPISYNFLNGTGFKIPKVTPLSELNININDYIKLPKFDFDFSGIDLEEFKNKLKVEVHFSDVWVESDGSVWTNVTMSEYIASEGDIASSADKLIKEKFCLIDKDGNFMKGIYGYEGVDTLNPGAMAGLTPDQRKAINAMIALLVEDRAQVWSAQLQEGFGKQLAGHLTSLIEDINGVIDNVSSTLEGNLTGKLQDMLDKANGKLNSLLSRTDSFVKQLNAVIENFNVFFANPNLRLQATILYEGEDTFFHPMSNARAIPTIVTGKGEGLALNLTSYTGEVLSPAYKKYIAVTNVYRAGKNADEDPELMKALQYANNVKGFNEVITGDRYEVVFSPDKNVTDAVYEIVYSALDFYGNISQSKYYVTVK